MLGNKTLRKNAERNLCSNLGNEGNPELKYESLNIHMYLVELNSV